MNGAGPLILAWVFALVAFAQEAPSRRPTRPAIPFEDLFRAACGPRFLHRVAQSHVESRWNPRAVSPVGAKGLMQAMDPTWGWYVERGWVKPTDSPFDPAAAIVGGDHHMSYLETFFHGDQVAAWASFNWGQGRVLRVLQAQAHARQVGRATPQAWIQSAPRETQDYVVRIPATEDRLTRQGVK